MNDIRFTPLQKDYFENVFNASIPAEAVVDSVRRVDKSWRDALDDDLYALWKRDQTADGDYQIFYLFDSSFPAAGNSASIRNEVRLALNEFGNTSCIKLVEKSLSWYNQNMLNRKRARRFFVWFLLIETDRGLIEFLTFHW